ncbi:MAG TPA: hypothetical protein ENJ27_00715 [Candidatus Moranbacteria bacterium]|nr:hypothetical protein [Candidatus Moranbacteria bacterium]
MRFGTKSPDNGATWSIGTCSKCGEKNQYVCSEIDFGIYNDEIKNQSEDFINFFKNITSGKK